MYFQHCLLYTTLTLSYDYDYHNRHRIVHGEKQPPFRRGTVLPPLTKYKYRRKRLPGKYSGRPPEPSCGFLRWPCRKACSHRSDQRQLVPPAPPPAPPPEPPPAQPTVQLQVDMGILPLEQMDQYPLTLQHDGNPRRPIGGAVRRARSPQTDNEERGRGLARARTSFFSSPEGQRIFDPLDVVLLFTPGEEAGQWKRASSVPRRIYEDHDEFD